MPPNRSRCILCLLSFPSALDARPFSSKRKLTVAEKNISSSIGSPEINFSLLIWIWESTDHHIVGNVGFLAAPSRTGGLLTHRKSWRNNTRSLDVSGFFRIRISDAVVARVITVQYLMLSTRRSYFTVVQGIVDGTGVRIPKTARTP